MLAQRKNVECGRPNKRSRVVYINYSFSLLNILSEWIVYA